MAVELKDDSYDHEDQHSYVSDKELASLIVQIEAELLFDPDIVAVINMFTRDKADDLREAIFDYFKC